MATPAQMFDNELNGVKVFYPGRPWVLDKVLPLSQNDIDNNLALVKAGCGAHGINDGGQVKWALGGPAASLVSAPVPHLLFQNATDFDVVGDDGNLIGSENVKAGGGQGVPRIMGMSVTMGAEVESTAYVAGVYATGDVLVVHDAADADLGKLEVYDGIATGVILVGVVSDGLIDNEHKLNGAKRLRFQTIFQIVP